MKNVLKSLAMVLFASMLMVGCNEKAEKYTITVKSNNDEWGVVLGGGEYEMGMAAEIAARPNVGYVFKQWDDGNTENPRVIAVKRDATYTAIFGEPEQDTTGGGGDIILDTNAVLTITFGDTTFDAGVLLRTQVSMGGGSIMYMLTATNDPSGNDIIVQWLWDGEEGSINQGQFEPSICYVMNNISDLVNVGGQQYPHYMSVDNLTVNVTRFDVANNTIDCKVTGRVLDMTAEADGTGPKYVNISINVESFRMTDYNH
jgi:hypothetical protein